MEQGFDIKKWRSENPMDYVKAIKLISIASNKNEVFKTIYEITRLYLPETLYKYYSLSDSKNINESKLKTLMSERIYMSCIHDFNDPFDSRAFYYNPSELMILQHI